jgi:hypothetical protein
MAVYSNATKNTTVMANLPLSSQSLTWDEAGFTWDEADGTWDNPYNYNNQTKNSTSFTGLTKN